MLIHSRIAASDVNGPGTRAVIWVQGCAGMDCPGCWNKDTHAFDIHREVDIFEMTDWVAGLDGIEGVTFSGGEPMQQAPSLHFLMNRIKSRRPDLSIGMFTGYTRKELEEGRFEWRSAYDGKWIAGATELWRKVQSYLDFAITGRYNQRLQTSTQPLCGSANQQVIFFTQRYSGKDLKPQTVEFTIDDDALVQITGFPVGMHEEITNVS